MRSRRARRLKEILAAVIGEFSEANSHSLRELALHRMALEDVQADVIARKPGAREHAVRISNVVARLERDLRAGRQQCAPTPSLYEYLVRKRAEASA